MGPLRVTFLGDFRLMQRENEAVNLASSRLRLLLDFLLLQRDAPQLPHRLAFLLWPDSSESQARAKLCRAFYRRHWRPEMTLARAAQLEGPAGPAAWDRLLSQAQAAGSL